MTERPPEQVNRLNQIKEKEGKAPTEGVQRGGGQEAGD